jgi:hypothetical protein
MIVFSLEETIEVFFVVLEDIDSISSLGDH